jgi:YVTN family beta-propeller protein
MHRARPATAGNRAPLDLVFSPDGRLAYVVEAAEGTLAVIDAGSRKVLRRIPTGGDQPAGLAVTPNGREVLVANSYSGTVAILDAATGKQRALVSVPGQPYGVAVAPDGKRAFVSVSQLDQVAVIDLPTAQVAARIPVGRRPRALQVTPDGATLTVANLAGGTLSVVSLESLKEETQVRLKGVNVRGLAITKGADAFEAFTTLMPAFNAKATSDPKEVWHNLVQGVRLEGEDSLPAEDQWMDFARLRGSVEVVGSPDQYDIEVSRGGGYAWIAVGGRDVVSRITLHDRSRNTVWPFFQAETPVGANPRGLALTPDGEQLWVANYLGNSLSVIDTNSAAVVETIDLGAASKVDPSIQGQYLFNSAGMTQSHRFSCSSCHPDGAADGLTWNFVHVRDSYSRRNTRDLRAQVAETAPFRWSGFEKHLDGFIDDEVTGLLGGPKPSVEEKRSLTLALNALRLPPNPYRQPNGTFTAEAARGRELFTGKAACSSCHTGPRYGGAGKSAWIGSTREDLPVDVPHLLGVYDGAPYLHDGRAKTLEEIFQKHNALKLHGKAHELTPDELRDLLAYVREL